MKIFINADFSLDGIKMLEAAGHEVKTGGWGFTGEISDEDTLITDIGDASCLIVGYEPVTQKVLDSTDLKVIFSIRGGPRANIDVDYCTAKGIPVFQTLGREAVPVADFTMGQLISLTRKITQTDRELRAGKFTAPDKEYGSDKDVIWDMSEEGPWQSRKGMELEGKTIGLIGLGTVGQQVAKRAKAFGMKVIAFDPYQKEETFRQYGVERVNELEELLASAHVITVHAKVDASNQGIIGDEQFKLMRDGVFILNNARAGIFAEGALRQALRDGKLGGMALDVFHSEPIKGNDEYFNYPNVILTPHIAGAGRDVIYLQSVMIVNDLLLYLGGGMPKALVNPDVFRKSAGK